LAIALDDGCLMSAQPVLRQAVDFMILKQHEKKRLLVHCHQGISRSSTLVLAFLIAKYRLSLDQALLLLRRGRKVVTPNPRFWRNLLAFEFEIHNKRLSFGIPSQVSDWVI